MADDAVFNAALAWWQVGACVLPAATDGSKRPGLTGWKQFQTRRPDLNDLASWFAAGHAGMGVVCGKISGGLEMVEFEARAMDEGAYEAVAAACEALGLGELWQQITTGYIEESPTGGRHLYFYVSDVPVPGNTKIARRPATEAELSVAPDDRIKVLIETRGEGGWVVTAPSNGTTHPSGRSWTVVAGQPATIPTITGSQRESLVRVMRAECDDMLFSTPVPDPLPPQAGHTGLRPGDDFEARTSWAEILQPHGWRVVGREGRTTKWCRPGKAGLFTSATTGNAADRDRLYVFSSSTVFDPERPYTKFGAYALLNHGGDHSVAAKALKALGFGDEQETQADLIAALLPQSKAAVSTPITTIDLNVPQPTQSKLVGQLEIAESFAQRCRPIVRSTARLGWFVYEGGAWVLQDDRQGTHWRLIEQVCREVSDPKDTGRYKSASFISGVELLARRNPDLQVPADGWDPDAHLFNTAGGIVDVRTGLIGPHNPEFLITRISNYTPDPNAQAPRWFQFLDEIFQADRELTAYVQKLLGYSLLGHNQEQIIALCYGHTGQNGKTVLLETVRHILGSYALKANSEWFMVRTNGPHPTELLALDGPRFVLAAEVADAAQFDEQRLKELSGGDAITCRVLYANQMHSFIPKCTLWLMANDKPIVKRGGSAFFRRVRVIPFLHRVPDDKKDNTLGELFQTPEYGNAILYWLIEGCIAYHREGLTAPAKVSAATGEYEREAAGASGEFLDERCLLGGGDAVKVRKNAVYKEYQRWCATQGISAPLSNIMLTKALRNLGVGETRDSKGGFYTNITVLAEEIE